MERAGQRDDGASALAVFVERVLARRLDGAFVGLGARVGKKHARHTRARAEPLGQIDKITIIGGGEGGNGVDQVAGNVPVVMAKVFESMKEATGIDLADIINAESYDAQVNRNINVSGLDSVNLVVKDEKKGAEQPDAQDGATTE